MASLKITVRSSATEERTVEVPIPSRRPLGAGGNTEVREFLAMRARQQKTAARVRRIKRTCLVLGAATAAAAFVVPKWQARWGMAAATVVTPEPAGETAPEIAPDPTISTPAPVPEPGPQEPAAASEDSITMAAVAPSALVATGRAAATLPASDVPATEPDTCQQDFEQRRWRAAVENCTLVFEKQPSPALALKIAHAHWGRSDVLLAGEWADKAVALGTEDADAYVLIGHARRLAGDTHEAIAAYRQYLRASPRGWHARTVRAALRRLRPAPAEQQATSADSTAQMSLR